MFTGLIEETGTITNFVKGSISAQISISAKKVLNDLKPGDSLSTNGACLTVISLNNRGFTVDVMAETLRTTALSGIAPGQNVNLERALKINERFGGHLVSGHIDGTAEIIDIKKEGIASILIIKPEKILMKYIINKGSVAVDGISLTVSDIHSNDFAISIIPHTAANTTLPLKQIGDKVNIETDMIAKYLHKLISTDNKETKENKPSISIDSLVKNGF